MAGINLYRKEDKHKVFEEELGDRLPFLGLGAGVGVGFSYKIKPQISLIGEYNVQVSYCDLYSVLYNLAEKRTDQEKIKVFLRNDAIIKPFLSSKAIRQRVTIGIEFHSSTRDL